MRTSEKTDKLEAALKAARKAFGPIKRDKNNPFFNSKYADLAGIKDATDQILENNGLVLLVGPYSAPEGVGVEYRLSHTESGQYQEGAFALPTKQDAQAGTGGVTYARRTMRSTVLDLITEEDDDGNRAAGRERQPRKQKDSPQPKQQPRTTVREESAPVVDSSPLPTQEEFQAYRDRGRTFANNLKLWGMKGDPLQKMSKYFILSAKVQKLDQISKTQWETIFGVLDKVGNKAVEVIEAKIKETE